MFYLLLLQVLEDQRGSSTIPFKVSGPMERPNVKLDTSKIVGGGLQLPGGIEKKLDKVLKKKGVGSMLQKVFPGVRNSQQPAKQRDTGASEPQTPQPQKQQQSPAPRPEDFLKNILRSLGR